MWLINRFLIHHRLISASLVPSTRLLEAHSFKLQQYIYMTMAVAPMQYHSHLLFMKEVAVESLRNICQTASYHLH